MRIQTTNSDGVAFLVVTGELDLAHSEDLREAGEAALTPFVGTLRVDLSRVTFIDSTGLSVLVAILNAAESTHTFILENPQPRVRRVLELTGLNKVFAIDPPNGDSA
jgi:anti-anti-sigma factor